MPSGEESSRLALPDGTPVVLIRRTASEASGALVEINAMALDASAYVLVTSSTRHR